MESTIIVALIGVISVLIGSIGTWLVTKENAKVALAKARAELDAVEQRARGDIAAAHASKAPDVQAAINAAMEGLARHYTAELKAATDEVVELRLEIRELRVTIADLEDHTGALTDVMKKAGVTPPARRPRTAKKESA